MKENDVLVLRKHTVDVKAYFSLSRLNRVLLQINVGDTLQRQKKRHVHKSYIRRHSHPRARTRTRAHTQAHTGSRTQTPKLSFCHIESQGRDGKSPN